MSEKPTVLVSSAGNPTLEMVKEIANGVNVPEDVKLLESIGQNQEANADSVPDSMEAKVVINPNTGEQMAIFENDETELSPEEKKEIEDRVLRNAEELDHLDPTSEEIREAAAKFEDFNMSDISDIAIYKVIDIIKRIQAKEDINVYRELPEELRKEIDKEATKNGFGGNSPQAKSARNAFAKISMDSFINTLQFQKMTTDLNKELTAINNEMAETMIGFTLDSQEERHKLFEKYVVKYEEDGEFEKAQKMRELLNAIHDGYTLEPLKEAARNHKIRIKKFDIEKPARVIDPFLNKYINSTQNIFSPYEAMKVLFRNTRGEDPIEVDDIYRFFVAFCKFCQRYSPSNPMQNAFMYYVNYNCMMLDFKGKDGKNQDFIDGYIRNVKEVVSLLKSK